MTTIARLVTAVEADPRGLTRGLQQSSSEIRRFTTTLAREMKNLPTLNIVTPAMLKHLQQTKGDIEKATAAANRLNDAAQRTAQSFAKMRANAALLRDEGLARQIRSMDPFQAGGMGGTVGSLARSQSSGYGQGRNIANMRSALGVLPVMATPAAAQGITRTQGALISLLFTMTNFGEQLAATDTKWGKLEKTVGMSLQALSGIALMFGPKGLIVSGIAIALSFIMDFFAQTREEADRTARAMEDSMKRLIDSQDSTAMMLKLRDLNYGAPSAGNSTAAPGAFKGGLMDLEAQLAAQKSALGRANFVTVRAVMDSIADLEKQLAPLRAQRDQLVAAIMNPRTLPEIRGAPAMSISATRTPNGDEALAALEQRATALIGLHRELAEANRVPVELGLQLLHIYDDLGGAVLGMKDQWSTQAISVKRIRNDIEAILANPELTKLLNSGVIPRPGSTPNIPPMAPVRQAPSLGGGGPSMMTRLNASALGPLIQSISSGMSAAVGMFTAAITPAALLLRALEPAFAALQPLLDNLVAPLAAVALVVVQGLEPALKLLFPIVRLAAIGLSYFFEIMQRISAALVRLIGNVLIAVGGALRRLSFGLTGRGIENAGQSLLNYSDEAKASADRMMRTRENLERMQWGDTAEGIAGLGDAARSTAEALRNVPDIWKVEIARFRAAAFTPAGGGVAGNPPRMPGTPPTGPQRPMTPVESPNLASVSPGGAGIVFYGPVTIETEARDGEELWNSFVRSANRERLRRTGTSSTSGWEQGVL